MRTVHSRKGMWAAFVLPAAVLASSLLFVSVVVAAPPGPTGAASGRAAAIARTVYPAGGHGMVAYPGGRALVARGHSPLVALRPVPPGYAGLAGITGAVVIMGTLAVWARGYRSRTAAQAIVTELGRGREEERDRRAA